MKRYAIFLLALVLVVWFAPVAQAASPAEHFEYYTGSNDGYSFEAVIKKYVGPGGDVVVPKTLDGHPVTYLDDYAFGGREDITSVILPDGLHSIEDEVFFGCTNLETVTVPSTVTWMGKWAFAYCEKLTSINIPEGMTLIKDRTFDGCTSLVSVTIPSTVDSIGAYAFSNCDSLVSITVPPTVEWVSQGAFSQCSNLESAILPSTLTEVDDYLFYRCTKLASITIPTSAVAIGEYAFAECDSLTALELPNSVTVIGSAAFNGSDGLHGINLPAGVETIGDYVFQGCSSLSAINVSELNTVFDSVDGVLMSEARTKLIAYPGGKDLEHYAVPQSVTEIGDYAFSQARDISSVTIPSAVDNLGFLAFSECSSLLSATFEGDAPVTVAGEAFDYCADSFTIWYNPSSSGWTTPKWQGYSALPIGSIALCTVNFDSQGGSTVPPLSNVVPGTKITAPTTPPTKPGFTFVGWYKDTGLTLPWSFTTDTVTSNTTIYAKWSSLPVQTYTITFKRGTTTVSTVDVAAGATATSPNITVPSGYKFMGWYDSAGKKFSSATAVNASATYTARFYSTNAYLARLSASTGKWSSRFAKTRYAYTLTLARTKAKVKIAARAHSKATVSWSYNRTKWYAGSSKVVGVSRGKSKYLYFKVVSQAKTTRIYKVKVYRKR